MPKSPDAFRTISEVADWLGIQAHVLRFWESKFTQVKPIKRAGGRRYYRPADMKLLGGIKKLLHDDGLTIKGVQKLLREEGMSHVSALSQPLEGVEDDVIEAVASEAPEPKGASQAVVLPFEAPKDAAKDTADEQLSETAPEDVKADTTSDDDGEHTQMQPAAQSDNTSPDAEPAEAQDTEPTQEHKIDAPHDSATPQPQTPQTAEAGSPPQEDAPQDETALKAMSPLPDFISTPAADLEAEDTAAATEPAATDTDEAVEPDSKEVAPADISAQAPAEVRPEEPQEMDVPVETAQDGHADVTPDDAMSKEAAEKDIAATQKETATEPEPPAPKARDIGMPEVTAENEIAADTASLSRAFRLRAVDAQTAQQMKPLLAQLQGLRDKMAAGRNGAQPKS